MLNHRYAVKSWEPQIFRKRQKGIENQIWGKKTGLAPLAK